MKKQQAQQLAEYLHLPLVASNTLDYYYLLVLTQARLELRKIGVKAKPVAVDFLSPAANYRRLHGGGKAQLIARAVGIKKNLRPTVLDATAGLGQDAFVLACLGCQVHCLERSPILAALLQDGLRRLHADDAFKDLPLTLTQIDAKDYLQNYRVEADVIYLDPMFPARNKTALAKKEMRCLQDLVGHDEDAQELLALALARAKKRVVIKRPRLAPVISAHKPSLQISGQSSRFDVYL